MVGSQPMLPALQVIELKMQCVQDAALWWKNCNASGTAADGM